MLRKNEEEIVKKTALLGLVAVITLYSCGDSPRTATIQPPPTILGSNYIPEAFDISLEAERNLPIGEMQNIMTTHFDTINKIEVGMRWKTKQVSKIENDQGNICFRRTQGIKEVEKVENDKISISFDGTVEYLEGRNCWLKLNNPDVLVFTASEDNQTITSVDDVEWDEFQADQFKVGFYNQKETLKNSTQEGLVSFETFFYSKSPFFLYFMASRTVEEKGNGSKVLGFAEINQPL